MVLQLAAYAGLANMFGKKKKRKKANAELQRIQEAGGLANYDPAYGAAQSGLAGQLGAEGPAGQYAALLNNFQGRPENMEVALRRMAPFIPGSLANTAGFKHMQNFQNFDYVSPQDRMMGYGAASGKIAQGASNAYQQGAQSLGRSGLGNSSAMASLASQTQMGAGGQQADLYAQMYEKMLQQRIMNTQMQAQYADQAFDQQRSIAAMALGAVPGERTKEDSMWPAILGMFGQVAGSAIGGMGGGK